MSATSIQWTDATWNPIRGCSRVSEGCRNCYAERMAARNLPEMRSPTTGKPFAVRGSDGPHWTGAVELIFKKLAEPLRWRKPRRVFVNSMSDLFHEALPDEAIESVFRIMVLAERHTFQILTKRPERMREFCLNRSRKRSDTVPANVWLGTSVEDQATADARIPLLLQTLAAKRFISLEPQLAPVNLEPFLQYPPFHDDYKMTLSDSEWHGLDWVIQGGESGPGARPFAREWAEATRDQCRAAEVPYFLKQMGRWILGDDEGFRVNHYLLPDGYGFVPPMIGERAFKRPAEAIGFSLDDPKGGDPEAWPPDLRTREFPA